jgi:hypothetical protein
MNHERYIHDNIFSAARNTEGDVRLTGGSTAAEGQVEIYIK